MLQASRDWVEYVCFVCEVQSVILLRLARLAQGGPAANWEACQMIAEKFDALVEAEVAMTDAFAHGEVLAMAERAYAPVRRRVHDNSVRLTHAAA